MSEERQASHGPNQDPWRCRPTNQPPNAHPAPLPPRPPGLGSSLPFLGGSPPDESTPTTSTRPRAQPLLCPALPRTHCQAGPRASSAPYGASMQLDEHPSPCRWFPASQASWSSHTNPSPQQAHLHVPFGPSGQHSSPTPLPSSHSSPAALLIYPSADFTTVQSASQRACGPHRRTLPGRSTGTHGRSRPTCPSHSGDRKTDRRCPHFHRHTLPAFPRKPIAATRWLAHP